MASLNGSNPESLYSLSTTDQSLQNESEKYDLVFKISSFEDLRTGCKILDSTCVQRKDFLKQSSVVNRDVEKDTENFFITSTLGEFNSGKTFVLNKVLDQRLPEEKTEGLSIKIVDKVIAIDSAGLDSPIPYLQVKMDEPNYDEEFEKIINNAKAADQFRQDFILSKSDLVIVVCKPRMLERQKKMLNNIKSLRKKGIIVVVHNNMKAKSSEDIENYVKYLKEEFKLIPKEKRYLIEFYKENPIYHFVIGNDEAQNKKNNQVFNKIKAFINRTISSFKMIDELKNHLVESSGTYLENKITPEDIRIENEKLFINKNFSLKKYSVDEKGVATFQSNIVRYTYGVVKENEEKLFKIILEIAGESTQPEVSIEVVDANYIIHIIGKKQSHLPEGIQPLYDSTTYGDYSVDIVLNSDEILIEREVKKINGPEKGITEIEIVVIEQRGSIFNVSCS